MTLTLKLDAGQMEAPLAKLVESERKTSWWRELEKILRRRHGGLSRVLPARNPHIKFLAPRTSECAFFEDGACEEVIEVNKVSGVGSAPP